MSTNLQFNFPLMQRLARKALATSGSTQRKAINELWTEIESLAVFVGRFGHHTQLKEMEELFHMEQAELLKMTPKG